MGHLGSGGGCRQSGSPGVGKEIQNFYGPSGLPDQPGEPVPVYSLLREQSGMFKAERLEMKSQVIFPGGFPAAFLQTGQGIGDGPFLRQVKEFPFAAALGAAVVVAVLLPPAPVAVGVSQIT